LQVLVMIGGILISLVPAILERVAAPTYPQLASAIGWFMIVVLPLTAIICLFSVPERETPDRPHPGFRRGAAILFSNMALLRLLAVNALLTFSTYFVQGLFVFFVSYTLDLGDRIGFILTFLIIGGLLGLPVWLRLAQYWNKHRAMQTAVITGALAPLTLLVLPSGYLGWAIAAFLVIGLNTSANEFLPRAMMADVCDLDHIESGSERMGLYYSLLQLSSKFASGTGLLIGFSFLTVFGFDPELGLNNSEEALNRLRYLVVALPVLAYAAVAALLWRYPISRERQRQMRKLIEERETLALGGASDQR
ncbi:MAG: MFS transporter, partial [Rhodospirillaceae bacterium]|nr:MFS transporter [Rhodospirillaceae bacterium]